MADLSRIAHRLAGVAVVALALTVSTSLPAGAHSGLLYTVTGGDVPPADARFATLDPSTSALTPLAGGPSPTTYASGIEISSEGGFAVVSDFNSSEGPRLVSWNHDTGATGASLPITLDIPETIVHVFALDTSPSGALLAFAALRIGGEFGTEEIWVVEIDPATGAATRLIDLTPLDEAASQNSDEVFFDSIATHPISGATYMFLDYDDGDPMASLLDLEAGTYSEPYRLSGIDDSLGNGWVSGADFDPAGTLWFLYPQTGDVTLASTTGDFSEAVGAVSSGSALGSNPINLTYDPAAPPQLADTGAEVPALVIAAIAAALLVAGVAASSRRRSNA